MRRLSALKSCHRSSAKWAKRATITLPQDLLTELVELVGARSKTEAVLTAVKDEIRLRKLARIKAMAGKMEFTASAEELRHGDRRLG